MLGLPLRYLDSPSRVAPSQEAIFSSWAVHRETVRKLDRLHQWDVCRANKAPFAFGVETRVPFLDRHFIDVSMAIDPNHKMVRQQDWLLSCLIVKSLARSLASCMNLASLVVPLYS